MFHELFPNKGEEFLEGQGPDVMGVDAERLGIGEELGIVLSDVKDGVGAIDSFEIKALDQLFP